MSDDLIRREDAIDALRYAQHRFTVADEAYGVGTVKWSEDVIYFAAAEKVLADLPSAQPERKKGKWIYGEHDIAMCDGYRCDQCGFFVPWDYKHKFIDFIKDYHWCPSCGADMRKESEVEERSE